MTSIQERITVSTVISTATMPTQAFDTLLLVDHADVPDADRILWVTPASYTADLTPNTKHYKWVETYFSQTRTASKVLLGKWKSTETAAEALAAVRLLEDEFWAIAAIAKTDPYHETLSLAAAVEATKSKFLFAVSRDAQCAVDGYSADIASVLQTLAYTRTAIIFTENTQDAYHGFVDAAVCGCVLPASPAGSVSYSWQKLVGIYESGKTSGGGSTYLSLTKRSALEGKYCNHVESLNKVLVCRKGINVSNVPIHLIQACDAMNSAITSQLYSFMINTDNPSFDKTLGAVEGIVRANINLQVANGVLLNTSDFPVVYNFPSLSSITAAMKALGTLTVSNCYRATLNYPVADVVVQGTWSI